MFESRQIWHVSWAQVGQVSAGLLYMVSRQQLQLEGNVLVRMYSFHSKSEPVSSGKMKGCEGVWLAESAWEYPSW